MYQSNPIVPHLRRRVNDNLSTRPEPYSAASLLAAMRLHPELSQIFFLTGHQIEAAELPPVPGGPLEEDSGDLGPPAPQVSQVTPDAQGLRDQSMQAGRSHVPRPPRQHVRFATQSVEPQLPAQAEQRPAIAIISADPTTGLMRPVHYENADKPTQIDVLSSLLVKTAVALAAQTEVLVLYSIHSRTFTPFA